MVSWCSYHACGVSRLRGLTPWSSSSHPAVKTFASRLDEATRRRILSTMFAPSIEEVHNTRPEALEEWRRIARALSQQQPTVSRAFQNLLMKASASASTTNDAEEAILRLILVFQTNLHQCGSNGALYEWGSKLSHSCLPNCGFYTSPLQENSIIVRASTQIKLRSYFYRSRLRMTYLWKLNRNGDVLSISYLNEDVLLSSTSERRRKLRKVSIDRHCICAHLQSTVL